MRTLTPYRKESIGCRRGCVTEIASALSIIRMSSLAPFEMFAVLESQKASFNPQQRRDAAVMGAIEDQANLTTRALAALSGNMIAHRTLDGKMQEARQDLSSLGVRIVGGAPVATNSNCAEIAECLQKMATQSFQPPPPPPQMSYLPPLVAPMFYQQGLPGAPPQQSAGSVPYPSYMSGGALPFMASQYAPNPGWVAPAVTSMDSKDNGMQTLCTLLKNNNDTLLKMTTLTNKLDTMTRQQADLTARAAVVCASLHEEQNASYKIRYPELLKANEGMQQDVSESDTTVSSDQAT